MRKLHKIHLCPFGLFLRKLHKKALDTFTLKSIIYRNLIVNDLILCYTVCRLQKGENFVIYKLNRDNYRDFSALNINRLPGRAYSIPFRELSRLKKTDCLTERYKSDMVTVLSGEWDFKYYETQNVLPYEMDTERIRFDKIQVPSTWQRTGYREPVYLNTRYEFHLFPPELPEQ